MGILSGISSFVKEHSEVIHGVLDVAGFIPGVGAVADLANAGLYAVEGNYLDAGLSLVSAIPGIGDTVALAKKSFKAVKGGLKGIKEMNVLKKAKNLNKVLVKFHGKAKTGALKPKIKTNNIDESIDVIKNEIKEVCTNGRCFTGDTLVYTSKGYCYIKEIKKGDKVYSRNFKTGETGLKEVEEVFYTTAHTIYHIWVNGNEAFKTTAYHPIYVKEQGWVKAINLCEGDTIELFTGFACITKIEKKRYEKPVLVYNFHVRDWASYFVGRIKAYVHNTTENHYKTIDELITNLKETTNGKGIARNFESSGGYEQTIRDFNSLNPVDVKTIQTQYGSGKVGKLNDGSKVVARQGSKTGGATLEIKVSNKKVYKIRY